MQGWFTWLSWLALAAWLSLGLLGCSNQSSPAEERVVGSSQNLRNDFFPGQLVRKSGSAAPAAAPTVASAPGGAKLIYRGGRVVSNVQVVQVIWGSGSYIPEVTNVAGPSMASFYQGVLNSSHVDWLSEYNTVGLAAPASNQIIGRGSFATQVVITPSAANNGSTIDDSNIKAELSAQIQAGTLPAPTHDSAGNNNTYYAVFFPHGKVITMQGSASCSIFCAYHGTIANAGGAGEIYYGVHPDFQAGSGCESGCGAAPTVFGNYTQVASHELIETVTDPEVGLAQVVGPPLAWYDASFGEIGDICNNQHGTVVGGDGVTYDVQTEYSNLSQDCVVSRTLTSSVTVSPSTFEGGTSATGFLQLASAAPAGGVSVALSSSAPGLVIVPTSVLVPAGATGASFPITSVATDTETSATLTATFPTGSATTTVTVLASPTVTSLTLNPTTVTGGTPATGTVLLSGAAPAGGANVTLSSNNTAAATVPATVQIPAGASSGTFAITTLTQSSTTAATISASYHNTARTAVLSVTRVPSIVSISASPSLLEGGGIVTGTVTLSDPAAAGGSVVALTSTSAVAPVPASVTVPAGQLSASFSIPTTPTSTTTTVTLSGTFPSTLTVSTTLTVVPSPTPSSITLNPSSIQGGGTSTATVLLSGPAPSGGSVVALSSSSTLAQVPATLAIPAGASSGTFSVVTSTTTTNAAATISATLNSISRTASLTITRVLPVGNAVYDSTLKAPRCTAVGSYCDSGGLIDGRGTMANGAESNRPNTLNGSCTDGNFGTYHLDESIDQLRISTLDNSNLAPGKTVRIDTTVWVFSGSDRLDLYLTTDATAANPVWTQLTASSLISTVAGTTVLSFTTTLPAATDSSVWAIRANYQYANTPAICSIGGYDDHDDVIFAVDSGGVPVNEPPIVNAGPDQSLTLPALANLSGTASDDGLPNPPATLTTTWSKLSGPGTVTFADASAKVTTATFSVAGSYTLRLTASDSALSSTDDIVVTVNPAVVNQPPSVNAGPDQTITLPGAANLSGTASDDGLPNPPATLTTTWSKVSGPGTVSFGNASAKVTTATFSVAGSYTLRLTASDSALSSTDDIVVTVNPAPVNQAPVVNAGPDQAVTLPAVANLSGTASDDGLPNPPATLTTTWSKVTGPGTVTFGNASAKVTTATFSAAGSYTLRLSASDSALTSTDDIVVTVSAAGGTGPCANLCTNPTSFSINGSFQSGNLGTGAVCYQTTSVVHGGNCGNFVSPRTLKVNGVTESCNGGNWASIPAPVNGGYCIQTTAGNQPWAYFTAW
ncbi:MAG TPA: hypothetical protein VFK05_21510 [Polyangiaceae bacterium]|nr:hypothetical protein [Polyangiaceae bacterium]